MYNLYIYFKDDGFNYNKFTSIINYLDDKIKYKIIQYVNIYNVNYYFVNLCIENEDEYNRIQHEISLFNFKICNFNILL